MRLQKYLARCGVASRRHAEKMIIDGRVSVNGETITTQGVSVDASCDLVCVDSRPVALIDNKVTYMLNKPVGYVTTMQDPQNRPTVAEFIERAGIEGGFPVGRLDIETSGLLLLTNDGDLAQALSHPSSKVDKTYIAVTNKPVSKKHLEQLRHGVDIGDFVTSEALAEIDGDKARIKLTIHEGKNRQVRRMFKSLGYRVVELTRVSYGTLSLGDLKIGQSRKLRDDEIFELLH